MGKTIFAEESIFSYLKNLANLKVCSTGLILGQSTDAAKDYVVTLVRTPEQSDKEVDIGSVTIAKFQTVKEIKESWISDHAKHVTKMLPGGMWVLGVFICSPTDLFSDNSAQSKAKSILNFLKKELLKEPLLYANSPSEKLLLHFNIIDYKYCCKTLDVNNINSNFQTVDWKFQNNYTKWCQIYCNFDPSQPSRGGNMSCPVKDQLKNALNEVNKNLDKAMVILNNQVKNPDETLDALIVKENLKDSQNNKNELPSFKANIFIPFKQKSAHEHDIVIKDCDVELHLLGVLASHVFLSHKSTIKEAVNAIKQDIVRSLATRFEMHWDSLVEEEYGSPEGIKAANEKLSVHEPPRRVSVILPNSKIAFNDYLFPGEGVSEVISSFKEMLDMNISEADVEIEIEMQGDSLEFYGKSSLNLSTTSSDELIVSSLPKGLLLFLFSVSIILIAVAVTLFTKKQNIAEGIK